MQYLSSFPGKPFNITVIQVYAPTTNAEAEVEWFYDDLQDLLEIIPKKRCPFHHRGLEWKVGSQEIPGATGKFGLGVQNGEDKSLTEFCQENALVIAKSCFQQHKRRLYKRTSPDSQYWFQIDCIICSQRWRSSSKNKTGSWLWLSSWTLYCKIQT